MYEFLLIFGALLWIALGGFYVSRRCASMFHPATFYLLFHGLVFVWRPILAWYWDFRQLYYAYMFTPNASTKAIVLAGADLGFVTFMVSVTHFGSMRFRFKPFRYTASRHVVLSSTLVIAFALCLPLAIYATLIALNERSSGVTSMIVDSATRYAVNTTSNGYLRDAALMLLPMTVVFAWFYRFKWWAMIPFLMAMGVRAATGSRWPFVMASFSFALFYLYDHRQRWMSTRLILGIAAVGLLFSVIGNDRGQSLRAFFGGQVIAETRKNTDYPFESMDYGNMEFFEYLVEAIPNKTRTYGYFLDNAQILTEPIPRVLWPGKPVGPPIQLWNLYDYGYPIGMTNSLPGEGWVQLGWIGIVIWCALFGWGYGRIYERFVRSRQSPIQIALYMTFLPLSIAVFRDGILLTAFKASAFTLLPILLWAALLRLRVKPRRRPTTGRMSLHVQAAK